MKFHKNEKKEPHQHAKQENKTTKTSADGLAVEGCCDDRSSDTTQSQEEEEMKSSSEPQINASNEQQTNTTTQEVEVQDKEKLLSLSYLDQLQRTIAEFDNFRKRTAKEKTVMYDDGVRDAVLQMLPVLDNFERAVATNTNKDDPFYKGIVMILKQFVGVLDVLGVSEINAKGQPFHPDFHSAVSHETDETLPENHVAEVLQKGYIHKSKVIRHSMVKVVN